MLTNDKKSAELYQKASRTSLLNFAPDFVSPRDLVDANQAFALPITACTGIVSARSTVPREGRGVSMVQIFRDKVRMQRPCRR